MPNLLNLPIVPDVSFYQSDPAGRGVDFLKMREATPAVIIRAGQGSWIDHAFGYNWVHSKDAGLIRSSYWYYDNRNDPKRQAELWVDILGDDVGEGRMWCDFEMRGLSVPINDKSTHRRTWQNWYDFMERIKQLRPSAKLGVYTGYYYFEEMARGMEYFAQYPLWIAWYTDDEKLIKLPSIWKDWELWQFTDNGTGSDYGVDPRWSKNIDLNYWKGSTSLPSKVTAKFGETQVEYRSK